MVAHVMRELRRQNFRGEKRHRAGRVVDAVITVRELLDLFPSLSDGVIRSRLRDRCNCVPQKVGFLIASLIEFFFPFVQAWQSNQILDLACYTMWYSDALPLLSYPSDMC